MHDDTPRCDTTPDDPFERARQAQARAIDRRHRRAKASSRSRPADSWRGSPAQRRGRAAEARAGRYLEARGLRLVARNLGCKMGEIDLVALDGPVLVFIEVRTRRDTAFGGAAASVNRGKQVRLIKTARYFLPMLARRHFGGQTPACRFDVVSLESDAIDWLRDAFME
uniref:YraN family protein n=1 Tax=Castellaniella defragrans TaxID=75697 RepID=UPI00333E4C96